MFIVQQSFFLLATILLLLTFQHKDKGNPLTHGLAGPKIWIPIFAIHVTGRGNYIPISCSTSPVYLGLGQPYKSERNIALTSVILALKISGLEKPQLLSTESRVVVPTTCLPGLLATSLSGRTN